MMKKTLSIMLLALTSSCAFSAATAKAVTKPKVKASAPAVKSASAVKGLDIQILKQGTGDAIKSGQQASVHYVGKLKDGKVFDTSRKGTEPFVFQLGAGSVIRGWDLGVEGMKVGELRKLTISPELGYGAAGAGGVIPPNATLIFEVELMKIN